MKKPDEVFLRCDCHGAHVICLSCGCDPDDPWAYMTIEGDFQSRSLWQRLCGALQILVHGEWCYSAVVLDKENARTIVSFLVNHGFHFPGWPPATSGTNLDPPAQELKAE